MAPRLVIYDGQEKFLEVPLEGEKLTVGRDPSSDVVLPDPSVSRRHAEIERTGNFYLIRDNGSTNGTFVNDLLARVQLLSHGDMVRVGKYVLRVEARLPKGKESTKVRVEKLALAGEPEPRGHAAGACGREDQSETAALSRGRLERLRALQSEIGYLHREEQLLDRSLEAILASLDADRGCFLLPRGRGAEPGCGGDLEARDAISRLRGPQAAEEVVIPESLASAVLESRAALIFPLPERQSPARAMGAPLIERGRILGVLYVDRLEVPAPFDEEDRLFLAAAAQQIGVSLANARLFDEICREKEKVQAILTSLHDGVLVADGELRVTQANRAATILLGLEEVNPIGQELFALLEGFAFSPSRDLLLKEARCGGAAVRLVSAGKTGDRALAGRLAPLGLEPGADAGEHRGVVMTLRDRTHFQRLERLKSRFIEAVAHKLRTPLTVIDGNLALLRAPVESEEVRLEIIDDMERNSRLLCRLVEQFVEFSEMDLRHTSRSESPAPIDVKKLVALAMEAKAGEATQRGILLRDEVPEGLAPVVVCAGRVVEALARILDNSVKFGDQGCQVVVEVEVSEGYLKLYITDDGPGIPAGEIEDVFALGHQVDQHHTGEIPGAGLGLPIARHLVQGEGGDLRVASPFGFSDHGTRVTVVLPLPAGAEVACRGEGEDPVEAPVAEAVHGT